MVHDSDKYARITAVLSIPIRVAGKEGKEEEDVITRATEASVVHSIHHHAI